MMITLSEGVQNQSNPNPNASLPSPQAISKVGIDYSTHSCLLGEVVVVVGGEFERDCLRNGEMIIRSLGGGGGFVDVALMLEEKEGECWKQTSVLSQPQ